MVPVSIRLPLADATELERRAAVNGVTPSQQVREDVQVANRTNDESAPSRP